MAIMKRSWWIVGFLTATGLAIIAELVAAFDGSANTTPWTELIVTYLPWPVWLGLSLFLAAWLPAHLVLAYRRRKRSAGGPDADRTTETRQ